jgi:hypothetical protein
MKQSAPSAGADVGQSGLWAASIGPAASSGVASAVEASAEDPSGVEASRAAPSPKDPSCAPSLASADPPSKSNRPASRSVGGGGWKVTDSQPAAPISPKMSKMRARSSTPGLLAPEARLNNPLIAQQERGDRSWQRSAPAADNADIVRSLSTCASLRAAETGGAISRLHLTEEQLAQIASGQVDEAVYQAALKDVGAAMTLSRDNTQAGVAFIEDLALQLGGIEAQGELEQLRALLQVHGVKSEVRAAAVSFLEASRDASELDAIRQGNLAGKRNSARGHRRDLRELDRKFAGLPSALERAVTAKIDALVAQMDAATKTTEIEEIAVQIAEVMEVLSQLPAGELQGAAKAIAAANEALRKAAHGHDLSLRTIAIFKECPYDFALGHHAERWRHNPLIHLETQLTLREALERRVEVFALVALSPLPAQIDAAAIERLAVEVETKLAHWEQASKNGIKEPFMHHLDFRRMQAHLERALDGQDPKAAITARARAALERVQARLDVLDAEAAAKLTGVIEQTRAQDASEKPRNHIPIERELSTLGYLDGRATEELAAAVREANLALREGLSDVEARLARRDGPARVPELGGGITMLGGPYAKDWRDNPLIEEATKQVFASAAARLTTAQSRMIESRILERIPMVARAVVVGDHVNALSVIVTLREGGGPEARRELLEAIKSRINYHLPGRELLKGLAVVEGALPRTLNRAAMAKRFAGSFEPIPE